MLPRLACVPCAVARVQAPKPSPGPHKTRECLPLILLLRNRLKYALTGKEVTSILMQRLVEVDGKVRTDKTYPVGFMDVIDIPKTGEGRAAGQGGAGREGGGEGRGGVTAWQRVQGAAAAYVAQPRMRMSVAALPPRAALPALPCCCCRGCSVLGALGQRRARTESARGQHASRAARERLGRQPSTWGIT